MTTVGRVVCVAFPYLATIGALISLIFVGIGSINSNSSTEINLFFFRADMTNLTSIARDNNLAGDVGSALSGIFHGGNATFEAILAQALLENRIRDFYDVALWGYCAGNKESDGSYVVDYCSQPTTMFVFDPAEVWGLQSTNDGGNIDNVLPNDMQTALNTYKTVTKWMFVAYLVAFCLTGVEVIVGLTAICSKIGSIVTSLISGLALTFTGAASITSTAMFVVMAGAFTNDLQQYGVQGQIGTRIFIATWLATLFALIGTLFWMFSSCCCSARSPYADPRRSQYAEKPPYAYEAPVAPYAAPAPVPVQAPAQPAYEPYHSPA